MLKNEIRVVDLVNSTKALPFKVISQVYYESDYTKFAFFNTNRRVDHAGRIKLNIMEHGWICNPILVVVGYDGKLYIVDGQNRFHALRELGFPIPFIVLEDATEKDMVALNLVSKNWTKVNYIDFYAKKGCLEYVKFKDVIEEYPEFKVSTLEYVLKLSCTNDGDVRHSSKHNTLERGMFVIKDIDLSREILDWCKSLRDLGRNCAEVYNQQNFVITVMRLYRDNKFDADTMRHKISTNMDYIHRCECCESYRAMLEEVYNRNRKGRSACAHIHLDF